MEQRTETGSVGAQLGHAVLVVSAGEAGAAATGHQPQRKLKHSRWPQGDSLGQVCTHSATCLSHTCGQICHPLTYLGGGNDPGSGLA